MKFVDCQGLAGHGTTLGAVRAGFELVHRATLPGAFGDKIVEDNAEILGGKFDIEVGDQDSWTPQRDVAYLAGVPPCSGFSLMNTAGSRAKARGEAPPPNARGAGSSINMCQRSLVEYAGKCLGTDGRAGPEFIAFESVQGAFSAGLELMRDYRRLLSGISGYPYELAHVKMSVASIGGAQFRHRYFWVAHRVPFGIDPPSVTKLTTVGDAIKDISGAALQWEPQPYIDSPTPYAKVLRGRKRTFEDNVAYDGSMLGVIAPLMPFWDQGKGIRTAARALLAAGEELTPRLEKAWLPEEETFKGFMWPFRVALDEPSPVLTGSCFSAVVHPVEDRFLTVRELARVMAIPDEWTFGDSVKTAQQGGTLIGKNCTTGAGEWMASAIRDALAGTPQSTDHEFWFNDEYRKIPLEPGERVYDITTHYKTYSNYFRRQR